MGAPPTKVLRHLKPQLERILCQSRTRLCDGIPAVVRLVYRFKRDGRNPSHQNGAISHLLSAQQSGFPTAPKQVNSRPPKRTPPARGFSLRQCYHSTSTC